MSDQIRRLVTGVADHLTLSLLWLTCSIPLVSAPAATAALFDVHRQRHSGADLATAAAFITGLKRHFRRSLAVGSVCLAVAAVLAVDFGIISQVTTGKTVLLVALIAVAMAAALVLTAIFPVMVATATGATQTLRTALIVAFGHPARSVLSLAVVVGGVVLVLAAPITLLAVPSALAVGLTQLYDNPLNRPVTGRPLPGQLTSQPT